MKLLTNIRLFLEDSKIFLIGIYIYLFKIPSSWKKIPFNRLRNIISIKQEDSLTNHLQDILTAITNNDEIADKVPLKFIPIIILKLYFVQKEIKPSKSKYIRIGFKWFKRPNFDSMTISMFTDLMVQASETDPLKRMLNITTMMFRPIHYSHHDGKNFQKRLKLFENASVHSIKSNFILIEKWIEDVVKRYAVIFTSSQETEEVDNTKEINSKGKDKLKKVNPRLQAAEDKLNKERSLWAWYGILDKLAQSDPLKFKQIENIPVHEALIWLSYQARLHNDELRDQRALQMKNKINKRR